MDPPFQRQMRLETWVTFQPDKTSDSLIKRAAIHSIKLQVIGDVTTHPSMNKWMSQRAESV